MTCQEFEKLLSQLILDKHLGESAGNGLEHAGTCPRCAARLADERALRAGLRALSSSARSGIAPGYLEDRLLQSFRKRRQELQPEPPITGKLPPESKSNEVWLDISSQRRTMARTLGWMGLAASVFLIAAFFAVGDRQKLPGSETNSAPEKPRDALVSSTPSQRTEPGEVPRDLPKSPVFASKRTGKTGAGDQRRRPAGAKSITVQPPRQWVDEGERSPRRGEVQTEFLPFMAARPLSPLEQSQVVRIRLPRSALHVFGLPVNMEGSSEPVQADVLLGEDGTALAVRFVR